MKEFELFESPESARAPRGQQLLFPHSSRTVCEEIGLNWWAALKLRAAGWLSFDPEVHSALDESQEAELRFVGALVVAGCDDAMLHRLLDGLSKPYSYRPGEIYFDWAQREWRHLPKSDIEPEKIFSAWLEHLRDNSEVETLQSLAREIESALAEAESLNPGNAGEASPT